jgi:inorganic pyrophosphatase
MAQADPQARPAACRFLGQQVTVHVDRPMGSTHPHHGFLYPVNYGYLLDELAPDGEFLDAYILGVFEPVASFSGRCIAVIHRLDDQDDKIVIAPDGSDYADEQILALTEFQERFFQVQVLR